MFKDVDMMSIFFRNRVLRLRQKTALAQCTVLAMAASLETVPPLYQVNGKTVPPENHGNVRQRLGIRIK